MDQEFIDQEFDRFVEAMRIDLGTEGLDENDRRSKENDIRLFKLAVADGRLTVDDDGFASFTPLGAEKPIKWYRSKGSAYTAMDKKKKSSDAGKMFASMAAITRANEITFVNMDIADLNVCMAIWALFLG
jgi:hypothetical protein